MSPSLTAALAGPDCLLEHAVYENPRTADGTLVGGYELAFRPDPYGSSTQEVFTLSLVDKWSFEGEIVWPNGITRPYAYISHPCVESPHSTCKDGEVWDIYRGEAYGLRVDAGGRITTQYPFGPEPAPPTILLPNLSAQVSGALRHFIEGFRAPDDLFYLVGCTEE